MILKRTTILCASLITACNSFSQAIEVSPSDNSNSEECNCYDFTTDQDSHPFYEPDSEIEGYSYFWLWGDSSHTEATAPVTTHCFNGSESDVYNVELQLTPRKKGDEDLTKMEFSNFQGLDQYPFETCSPSNFDGALNLSLNRDVKIGKEVVLIVEAKSCETETKFDVYIDYSTFELIDATQGFVQNENGGSIEQGADEFKNYYITLRCRDDIASGTSADFELARSVNSSQKANSACDNVLYLSALVSGGPYDPNILVPSLGENLTECDVSNEWVTYFLQFKNEGSGPTQEHVKLLVELDDRFVQNSVEIITIRNKQSDSWDMTNSEFYYNLEEDFINWPSAYTSENVFGINCHNMILDGIDSERPMDSYGYVTFRAKLKDDVQLSNGEELVAEAKVYFDYEAPITTNEAITSCKQSGGNTELIGNLIGSPNPTSGKIQFDDSIYDLSSLKLYNQLGAQLEITFVGSNCIDISNLTDGVYYATVETAEGVISTQIIKN